MAFFPPPEDEGMWSIGNIREDMSVWGTITDYCFLFLLLFFSFSQPIPQENLFKDSHSCSLWVVSGALREKAYQNVDFFLSAGSSRSFTFSASFRRFSYIFLLAIIWSPVMTVSFKQLFRSCFFLQAAVFKFVIT